MADIYNVVRGDGVFFEGMTKEQIYELIAEMTGETVQDIDQAFITKLKEINKGNSIRLWVGTSAEYNALTTREDDVLYICTDDTFVSDTNASIVDIQDKIQTNYDSVGKTLERFNDEFEEFKQDVENDITAIENSAMKMKGYTNYGAVSADVNIGAMNVGDVIAVKFNTGYENRAVKTPSSPSNAKYYCTIRHYYYTSGDDASWYDDYVILFLDADERLNIVQSGGNSGSSPSITRRSGNYEALVIRIS